MTYLIFALAVLTRFVPHPWNFSPVFGALLFGGAKLPKRDAIWFPVAVLTVSDVLLTTQVYGQPMQWSHGWSPISFAAVAAVGWALLRSKTSIRRFAAAAAAGPSAFYIISNLGVWIGSSSYPKTWQGLTACYVAALPYYRNSLLASFVFGAALFGIYEFYTRKPRKPQAHVATSHAN